MFLESLYTYKLPVWTHSYNCQLKQNDSEFKDSTFFKKKISFDFQSEFCAPDWIKLSVPNRRQVSNSIFYKKFETCIKNQCVKNHNVNIIKSICILCETHQRGIDFRRVTTSAKVIDSVKIFQEPWLRKKSNPCKDPARSLHLMHFLKDL